MTINKILLIPTFIIGMLVSHLSFAQSDSTNLPGLSATRMTTPTTTSGTGVPDPNARDATTNYTETMVDACPTTGGNGYGYYPNGSVPGDGSNVTYTDQAVQGGVVYDRSVTVDRFGTTTYGAWTQVNFLCTAIPTPPACASGQTQTAAPYWDWGSESWQGLQCTTPNPTSSTQAGVAVSTGDLYCNWYHQNDYANLNGADGSQGWYWYSEEQTLVLNSPTNGTMVWVINWLGPIPSAGTGLVGDWATLPSGWQNMTEAQLEQYMNSKYPYGQYVIIPNGSYLQQARTDPNGLALYYGGCGQGGG